MRDEKQQPDHMLIGLWLDFYGPLLTARTRDVLDLYYDHDLSLAEIAENLDISRQAVHDKVRQGSRLLEEYETKLGLAARHQAISKQLQVLRKQLESDDREAVIKQVSQIENLLQT